MAKTSSRSAASSNERNPLEAERQQALVRYLTLRGWFVVTFIGNAYQTGVPDVWAHHPQFGFRWIDLKRPGAYSFTRAQRAKWPKWDAAGVGIWILEGDGENEYAKLFRLPNWRDYWKAAWGDPTPLIDELAEQHRKNGRSTR